MALQTCTNSMSKRVGLQLRENSFLPLCDMNPSEEDEDLKTLNKKTTTLALFGIFISLK